MYSYNSMPNNDQFMYSYQPQFDQYSNSYNTTSYPGGNDDRFIGGGVVAPLLLGGIAGYAIGNNRPVFQPQPYPYPYPLPAPIYYNNYYPPF